MGLKNLFGSESVVKVLFFLFVNEKGYGSLMQKVLKVPLTPLQNALVKLENGGIVLSYLEGKMRFYKFNQACFIHLELQQLLRKAFTQLSIEEQRSYYAFIEGGYRIFSRDESPHKVLRGFWKKLSEVNSFSISVLSRTAEQSWVKSGAGEVISTGASDSILFHERGHWDGESGMSFRNVYRWTLDFKRSAILLEHLRQGADNPVLLLQLSPVSSSMLSSTDPHICTQDSYFGKLQSGKNGLTLKWRVIGPQKNQEIRCTYSPRFNS